MLPGVPTPKYIRSVKIFNNTTDAFEVTSKFDSGKTTHTTISAGETKLIEELTQNGSAFFVDRILTMEGHRTG